MKKGDRVVLDSGYTPGENGAPFVIEEKAKDVLVGHVYGRRVAFFEWQAAHDGTKRAKTAVLRRQLFNARRSRG